MVQFKSLGCRNKNGGTLLLLLPLIPYVQNIRVTFHWKNTLL